MYRAISGVMVDIMQRDQRHRMAPQRAVSGTEHLKLVDMMIMSADGAAGDLFGEESVRLAFDFVCAIADEIGAPDHVPGRRKNINAFLLGLFGSDGLTHSMLLSSTFVSYG